MYGAPRHGLAAAGFYTIPIVTSGNEKYWDIEAFNDGLHTDIKPTFGQYYTVAYLIKWKTSGTYWKTLLRNSDNRHYCS